MRIIIGFLITCMALLGAFAQASAVYDTEKVKTGILPSGGFYVIYQVDCTEQFTAEIASLKGKRRWCTSYDGEMSCFQRKQDASHKACLTGALAAADDSLEGVDKQY